MKLLKMIDKNRNTVIGIPLLTLITVGIIFLFKYPDGIMIEAPLILSILYFWSLSSVFIFGILILILDYNKALKNNDKKTNNYV